MKKTLCILLSILICFSASFVTATANNTYILGDVDEDGEVNIFDATYIQLYLSRYVDLSDTQVISADVDADGCVNIFDVTTIQRFLAKIIDKFPQPDESVTPSKVENITAQAFKNTVTLRWEAIDSAQKYWVYMYDVDSLLWKSVASSSENQATVTQLGYDKTYTFKIVAKLSDNIITPLSNADETHATTDKYSGDKQLKIENTTAQAFETSVTLSWDLADDCNKYWVYKLTDSGYWEPLTSTSTNRVHIANLNEYTTYKFKVIGIFSDNTLMSLYDSDTVTTTTAPVPTQPPTEDPYIPYAQRLKELQGDNTLTLSVMADVHYDEKDAFNKKKADVIEDLGKVQQMADVDLTCVLGDLVIGNVDKETTLTSLNALLDLYRNNVNTPLLTVRGNHDDNGWYSYEYEGTNQTDEIINDKEWWDIVSDDLPDGFVTDKNNPYGGYGYYDHEDTKTRIFMLNSSDIPYIIEKDGSYRYNAYQTTCFSNEQLNFVAQSLMFSDKDEPNEWAALFLVHIPLDTSNHDGERFGGIHSLTKGSDYMLAIIDAYRKGTSLSATGTTHNSASPNEIADDFNVSVDVDYSKKGCGEVISFVSGHTHADNYCNEVGGKGSLSYGYPYIGFIGSTSFANLIVDRNNNTVTVLKYGGTTPAKENEGVQISKPDSGSIASGEWTIKYSNELSNENLFSGFSELYPCNYTFDNVSGIDLETLELTSAQATSSPRALTKATPVKPFTTYILPPDYKGICMSVSKSGNKQTYIDAVDHGDYQTITTYARSSYLVFSILTGLYTDYENFYIKELHS